MSICWKKLFWKRERERSWGKAEAACWRQIHPRYIHDFRPLFPSFSHSLSLSLPPPLPHTLAHTHTHSLSLSHTQPHFLSSLPVFLQSLSSYIFHLSVTSYLRILFSMSLSLFSLCSLLLCYSLFLSLCLSFCLSISLPSLPSLSFPASLSIYF